MIRLLVVEDEPPIATYIEGLCREILGDRLARITLRHDLRDAARFLFEQPIDLCLLDLNLDGEDGYDLLQLAVSGSFQTIVISANTDRAVEAFRYGVLDFVAKPFDRDRLAEAFARWDETGSRPDRPIRYLTVRSGGRVKVVGVDHLVHLEAAGNYVEAHLDDGTIELLDKTMTQLGNVLPDRFFRSHRSCFVDCDRIDSFGHVGGGTYQITLRDGTRLPLSRDRHRPLKDRLGD